MEIENEDGVKKKINIDAITLAIIEQYFEYLSQIGQNEIDN